MERKVKSVKNQMQTLVDSLWPKFHRCGQTRWGRFHNALQSTAAALIWISIVVFSHQYQLTAGFGRRVHKILLQFLSSREQVSGVVSNSPHPLINSNGNCYRISARKAIVNAFRVFRWPNSSSSSPPNNSSYHVAYRRALSFPESKTFRGSRAKGEGKVSVSAQEFD